MPKTRILPSEWMPDAKVEAIVLHWTGGTRAVSNLDRKHYHFIIPENCEVERGNNSITANQHLVAGKYAAHVLNFNSHDGKAVIGVSICGMLNAVESPFNKGSHPITKEQWECAASVVADLSERYDVPVDDTHVLQHGEVQKKRGITQRQKWDVCKLPWAPTLSGEEVGDQFRDMVKKAKTKTARQTYPALTVEIDGKVLPTKGLLIPGRSLVPVKALLKELNVTAKPPGVSSITLNMPDGPVGVAFENLDGEGFVPATSLALALGWATPVFDGVGMKVVLKK